MRAVATCLCVVALELAAMNAGAQGPAPSASSSSKATPPIFHAPPRTPVTAQLDFTLGPGSGNCPGEEYLHQEVARRLGHDPFERDQNAVPIGLVRVVIAR